MPVSPPSARNASRDLGFKSLFRCPGAKAKGLSSTWKSASVPGSGRSAESGSTVMTLDPQSDCAGVRNGLAEADGVRKGFDIFDTNDPVGVTARVSSVSLLERTPVSNRVSLVLLLERIRVSTANVGGARLLL